MAYPYVPSGGVIQQAIDQFKKALPPKIDSATLKKLGVAPSNEGYVINTMKFLGLVDDNNERTPAGIELFTTHGDEAFAKQFEGIVRDKYEALFEIRGDEAWTLDRDALISFFRGSDKTTSIVGARQAVTFASLAGIAGKREAAAKRALPSSSSSKQKASTAPKKPKADTRQNVITPKVEKPSTLSGQDVALTVRIEINLPANGSQATYDNIFKSIRENLINQHA